MAKANTDYKDRISNFADRMKTEIPELNTQTVVPTKSIKPVAKPKVEEKEQIWAFNLHLPKSLSKKLKLYAVEHDATITSVINKAIESYIS